MRAARLFLAAPLLLALASLQGCGKTVSIRSLEPGPVQIGPARDLVVLDARGRRSGRETVLLELASQARRQGYFSVRDLSEAGGEVRLAGRRAQVRGPALRAGELGLRVDVLEWDSDPVSRQVTRRNDDGEKVTVTEHSVEGTVLLAISVFEAGGHAYLAEKEYEGRSVAPRGSGRDPVLEQAAARAVRRFLADVTPRERTVRVRLDDEDPGQAGILETAERGAIAQAAGDARRYLQAHPSSASAAYNLAVLLDAMGRHQEALDTYDRALSLGGKDFYLRARADCARRLASQRALSPTARRR